MKRCRTYSGRQVNAEHLGHTTAPVAGSLSIVVQTDKLYIEAAAAAVDTGAQKEQMQKEMEYLRGFVLSVSKKLDNEKFVANAKPEVIENEAQEKS